ncbi:helix-turn-helix domain-containing protein [Sporomusa sphaeroides DSM 2875]|jgi:sugar diacid utilization regulator|uniref:PucR family transcriptional regulator n=1 Tax=Sporomusa sphaeroides TaxID=47679 RepID=UPI002030834B|nr:helix-turn-helix domain-containing protein [Sporomusa sphaeroides]MCM0758224.1 helix-turn-helix domain-containing protein [Sporomusa sphaeroides DSM 2875]
MQQFCTVQELVTMEPFAQAKVVAGWAGRNNKVHKIVTAGPGATTQALAGVLVLVNTGDGQGDLPGALAAYLNSTAAGIIVNGYGTVLSPGLIAAAEKSRMPLLVFPQAIEVQELAGSLTLVLELVKNRTIISFSEGYRLRQLTNLSQELPVLLNQLTAYLQNPAVLLDPAFQLLAAGMSGHGLTAAELGRLVKAVRPLILERRQSVPLAAEPYHQQLTGFHEQAMNCFVTPLVLAGQLFGYLLVFEDAGPVNALDAGRIGEVGLVCLQLLINRRNTEEIEKKYKQQFLYDLLYNNFESTDELIKRGRYWDWELTGPQHLLVAEPDDFKQLRNKDRVLAALAIFFETFLRSHFLQAIVTEMQDQVIVIIPAAAEKDRSAKLLIKNLANLLQANLQEAAFETTVSFGIGKLHSSAAELCQSFQEAKHALDLGRFIREKGHITHFEDLGVIRLLSHINAEQLDEYYKEQLAVIIEYDEKNNMNFLAILQMYFQQNGDLNATAEKLFMHPNTLRYRLKKIEELLDVDLQKLEIRINLAVACKIAKMHKTNL